MAEITDPPPATPPELPRAVRPPSGRALSALLLTAVVVLIFGSVAILRGWFDQPDAIAEPTTTTTTVATTTTIPYEVPPVTPLASPHGSIPKYDAPGGKVIGEVGEWYGYDMTMPIVEEQGEWLRIMTPERPNQTTAWVHASQVTRSSVEYRIVVDLTEAIATVYKDGFTHFSIPVALGKPSTPTPAGSYFVAVIERNLGGGYGPIVLDLSAHSEAIHSWQGAGDAIIAFHGPFGSTERIKQGRAFLSNGCIRMTPEDQLRMAEIPLGTPVDLVP